MYPKIFSFRYYSQTYVCLFPFSFWAVKVYRLYEGVKNIIQPMLNYSQMLSQTLICSDLDVIQEINKITLKVWSNAFSIGNFYSYL